ncbi:hypothetical protein [Flavobacterium sp.]|uniref:hypothetical protein n=1 Tax=Flavobacterium sp. TaxID=239 RepID=UPI0040486C31
MRNKIFIFIVFFIYFNSISQTNEFNNTVIDTFYSGKYLPSGIYDSKIYKVIEKFPNYCKNQNYNREKELLQKREYSTLKLLNSLNERIRKNIFTDYSAVIVTYFCDNVDIVDEVYLFEFHYDSEILSKECIDSLNKLYLDKDYGEYIGTKNWFFIQIKKRVYLLYAKSIDSDNPTKVELQKRLINILKT